MKTKLKKWRVSVWVPILHVTEVESADYLDAVERGYEAISGGSFKMEEAGDFEIDDVEADEIPKKKGKRT